MKKSRITVQSIVFPTLFALFANATLAGERVGDFALIDHLGAFHHMAWYDDQNAVVILPQAVGGTDQAAVAELQNLRASYADQGIVFFLMNPGLQTDRAAVGNDLGGLDLPVLMDDAQLVTETLGITRLDEAVVYNPKNFEVLYRGPVTGVAATLEQVLGGSNPEFQAVATSGQAIEFQARQAHSNLSYARDIAPIIAENCAQCHREGGIAPFAMDSKLAVQGWSPMIREVVMTKRMPPGQIDNKVGRKIKNEMNLSDEEMQKLVHWINAGAQVEGNEDPLTALVWPDTKWTLGEPDLIVKVPPQTIPATGVVDYMDIPVDLGLEKDVWIRGSEVVPGEPAVLHHIITTVIGPEGRPDFQKVLLDVLAGMAPDRAQALRAKLFAASGAGGGRNIAEIFADFPEVDLGVFLDGGADPDMASIAGYAPGNSVSLNPPGVGGLLKAGTTLSLQMHYTTSGKEAVDATEIGIYFYPEGEIPEERMAGGVANDFNIRIPAQAKDHEMTIALNVPQDAEIYSLMPHMHFRGKRMKFVAKYPDGSEELLLSVPAYSFNWQLAHELEEPYFVPAGTQIIATGAFDNSSQNHFSPDPNSEVRWGEQSWEEMFMGFYQWKYTDQGGSE